MNARSLGLEQHEAVAGPGASRSHVTLLQNSRMDPPSGQMIGHGGTDDPSPHDDHVCGEPCQLASLQWVACVLPPGPCQRDENESPNVRPVSRPVFSGQGIAEPREIENGSSREEERLGPMTTFVPGDREGQVLLPSQITFTRCSTARYSGSLVRICPLKRSAVAIQKASA